MPSTPWPSIETGKLRHKGTIQSSNLADPDAFGQPTTSWSVVRTCWAQIQLVSARESVLPNISVSQVTHVITLRWTNVPVTAGMRGIFGSHTYEIQAVENVENRNVKLQLLALEINPSN